MCFVRDELNPKALCETRHTDEAIETTSVLITTRVPKQTIVLMTVYRPPNKSSLWFESFNNILLETLTIGPLIIMGDLNANLLATDSAPTKLLLKSLALANLKVPRYIATRISPTTASCLDIIALPEELVCSEYTVICNAASDHFPVTASITACAKDRPKPVMKRSFKRMDMNVFRQRAANIVLQLQPHNHSSDELLDSWHTSLTTILDEVAPIRNYPANRKACKWLTEDVRGLMQQRDSLARKSAIQPTKVLINDCSLLKRKVTVKAE